MHRRFYTLRHLLHQRKAQLMLPAVLLIPIFVLVMYLLVEVAKVSIVKIRHQFALDTAAYTQMTAVSVFLNAVAQTNGPLAYRVLRTMADTSVEENRLRVVNEENPYRGASGKTITVFDLFFQGGGVPTLASDYEWGLNPPPSPESTDWGIKYADYEGIEDRYNRRNWEKEDPEEIKGPLAVMNQEIVDKYYVPYNKVFTPALLNYVSTYIQLGDVFNMQLYAYKEQIKNANVFREGYFANTDDCRPNECARESAAKLNGFLSLPMKKQEAPVIEVYVSRSELYGGHGGSVPIPITMAELDNASPLFMFAYPESAARRKLRLLQRGVMLKQSFPLPRNRFNIDLSSRFKPYVRTTVGLSCPRSNNNCVWPNPLPKYSVTLRP